jgi:hypothetical protein
VRQHVPHRRNAWQYIINCPPRQKVHSMLHIYYAATDEQVQIDLGHIHKVANITTSGPKYRVQIE